MSHLKLMNRTAFGRIHMSGHSVQTLQSMYSAAATLCKLCTAKCVMQSERPPPWSAQGAAPKLRPKSEKSAGEKTEIGRNACA